MHFIVEYIKLKKGLVPASLVKRFSAFLIDLIIVNLVVSLPFYNYLISLGSFSSVLKSNDMVLTILTFLIAFGLLFYFTILEWKMGQTLGKALFRLKVISSNGKELNFFQSFLSNVTVPFSIVLLVDVIYMFYKNNNITMKNHFFISTPHY